jgi:hypothetical protein
MTDEAWVCGSCRSLNTRRSDRCYRCHAPRHVVEVDPSRLETLGQPTEPPPAPASQYQSSRTRAMVASGFILAASAASLVGWIAQSGAILRVIDERAKAGQVEAPVTEVALDTIIPVSHLQIGPTTVWAILGVCALVAWAAWLSRVVDNLPALRVGYARVSPQMAFIENFLMGRNLYSMPARVREVTNMLHPDGGGDEILAAAWLALFGSVIVGRVGAYGASLLAGSDDAYLRARIIIGGLTCIIAICGYVLVVAVIRRVERLAERRAADVAAGVAAELVTDRAAATASAYVLAPSSVDRSAGTARGPDPPA